MSWRTFGSFVILSFLSSSSLTVSQPFAASSLRRDVPPILHNASSHFETNEFMLRTTNFSTIMSIFSGLAPPSLPLEGEYLAELLDAGTGMNNMLATLGFGNPVLPGEQARSHEAAKRQQTR